MGVQLSAKRFGFEKEKALAGVNQEELLSVKLIVLLFKRLRTLPALIYVLLHAPQRLLAHHQL